MEIYMVLCCVLFTTAASLSSVDAISEYATSEHANDRLVLERRNCNCENGRCFTDKEGHMKCACKPGFALQDEFTCKPCDCGSLGQCIFVLKPTDEDQFQYQKKCVCDSGSAEKDGICVDCFCGENSACDFDHGERRCFCMEGYSEKDGVCTKCDCGFFGKCEYENGNKKCECDEGYLEVNGICEECDCGDHGTCSFQNGEKACWCQPGFIVNNGKCEQCDCGDHGTCSFQNGEKACWCQPGFNVSNEKCEPCDCGSNSKYCGFFNGVKKCMCKDGYADRYGTCEECSCGAFSRNCDFNNNQKTCSCFEGYVQKGETCEPGCDVQQPCQNGGYCKGGFCFCLNGTRGQFCESVDECPNLCPNRRDIKCSYDVASQKAYCRCLDSELSYYLKRKECKRICQTDYQCVNGVCRNGVCDCIEGTWGDGCEIVDCVTDAVKCETTRRKKVFRKGKETLTFLWKGRDTLFIIHNQKLLKFVRTNGVHSAIHYKDVQNVKCNDHRKHDIVWSPGYKAIFVSTDYNKWTRYQIESYSNSELRCG